MIELSVRRAVEADGPAVAEIWTAASRRLGALGLDQWQYPVRFAAIDQTIEQGTCWMIEDQDGATIGTVTVDGFADPKIWQPIDEPSSALYVHRLVLVDQVRGQEIGSAVLDWASLYAAAQGKTWLRLDAWTTNTALHRYYLDHGFEHVRTVDAPDIASGACFQRPAGVTLGLGPQVTA